MIADCTDATTLREKLSMPFISREFLRLSLEELAQHRYSPLLLVSIPCMLAAQIPSCNSNQEAESQATTFGSQQENGWLNRYFRLHGGPPGKPLRGYLLTAPTDYLQRNGLFPPNCCHVGAPSERSQGVEGSSHQAASSCIACRPDGLDVERQGSKRRPSFRFGHFHFGDWLRSLRVVRTSTARAFPPRSSMPA